MRRSTKPDLVSHAATMTSASNEAADSDTLLHCTDQRHRHLGAVVAVALCITHEAMDLLPRHAQLLGKLDGRASLRAKREERLSAHRTESGHRRPMEIHPRRRRSHPVQWRQRHELGDLVVHR